MRRLLAVLAAALVLLAIGARPAVAGGPTSVLLANPELSRATALYHSDTGYAELERLLVNGLAPLDEPPIDADIAPGSIHVTWLQHDVWVWRADTITLGPGQDVQVCTLRTKASGVLADECSWQRAQDPAALRAALADLGMVAGSVAPPLPSPTTGPTTEPGERAEPVAAASLTGGGGIGWLWAVGGALVGVLVGLLTRTTRRRGPIATLVDRI